MPNLKGILCQSGVTVLCTLAITAISAAQIVSFDGPRTYAAGSNSRILAVGDLNGDGKPDVVSAGPDSNTVNQVASLLNQGGGLLRLKATHAVGGAGAVSSMALGDFNGDGKLDVAVCCTGENVAIMLGNGDGTFQQQPLFILVQTPGAITVKDFNGDGKLDLAIGGVSILLGNGNGTFQSPVSYNVGGQGLTVGDFNGDGKPDLAVAGSSGYVRILLGRGDGTFQFHGVYPAGPFPGNLASGDFNGDGRLDLAVATGSFGSAGSVLLGNGDGSFQAPLPYGTGGSSTVAVGDFNGDGKLDLAIGAVSILLGNGDGTFKPPVDYAAGIGANGGLAVEDFNGDGSQDLAVVGGAGVTILLGNGHGVFQHSVAYVPNGFSNVAQAMGVGDFNRDARPDIAVAIEASNAVSIFLNGSSQAHSYPVHQPAAVAVGDFNGDGKPDLAVGGTSGMLSILLGNGDGSFGSPVAYSVGSSVNCIAVGDFNGDGKLDIVVNTGNTFSVLPGNGDGTFGPPISYAGGGISVAVADFNGDGKLDLAFANGSVSIFLGNGDGSFQAPVNLKGGTYAAGLVVADFNGDGKPDLAVTYWLDILTQVWLGNGDGTFRLSARLGLSASGHGPLLAAGDFNGDGKIDLALGTFNNVLAVATGKGDGTFYPASYFVAGEQAISLVAAADFNGDGKLDLAVCGLYSLNLLMNSTP